MPLLPGICPQCGATLEVDSTKDAAICKYCGTPFIAEKAINNITINNNYAGAIFTVQKGDADNYVNLAKDEFQVGNREKALEYINTALEIRQDIPEAWYLKTEIYRNKCYEEWRVYIVPTIKFANNAIEYAQDKDAMKEQLYKQLIAGGAIFQLYICDLSLRKGYVGSKAPDEACNDAEKAIDTLEIIPKSVYHGTSDIDHQILSKSVDAINAYIDFCNKAIPMGASDIHWRNAECKLNNFRILLPEEAFNKIKPLNKSAQQTNACYVATCVYGSYDCPQVWTLRRFRDYTLASTLFGRLFIHTYYAISPTIVKWFGETKWFKNMWKPALDNMVNRLNSKGIESTPYEDRNW